jgi:hypothetical protein
MPLKTTSASCVAALCAVTLVGCAVPRFDVPTDSAGQPTVQSIVNRVQCELRDMVRDDMGDKDPASFHRLFLLNGDYDVEVSLSLDVNDTGGLSPSVAFMTPLSALTSLAVGASATVSESRDHNFTENMQFSLRTIYLEWKKDPSAHNCPAVDQSLSGTLGLKDFVAMADLSTNLDTTLTLKSGNGVFGGSVQFLVTKNMTAAGPTWSLQFFRGPGTLGSLSEVNTDKLTVAFAQGPNVGKPMPVVGQPISVNPRNPVAYQLLQQLLTSSINNQLNLLNNNGLR